MKLSETKVKENSEKLKKIVDNVETVILGKRSVVELVMLSMICGGHVLLEDVPGVGKTSLVSALAKSVDCSFKRIQFTPDVMPSDVTGFSIYNQKTQEFEFRSGAVMSNLVLADEINRASAKTQSSLLEAMEEKQVTVDANTYKLEEPFMVMATQNPIESYGTYPLPEAQIDRFLIKTAIGYPDFKEEIKMVELGNKAKKIIGPVATGTEIVEIKADMDEIYVSSMVSKYIVEIITATRNSSDLQLGSSPRGSIALHNLSKAYAMYNGRNYVIPDDVKFLAPYVLGHRLILTHEAKLGEKTPEKIIREILETVIVPTDTEEQKG
ncbi:MAG: MoxR family ATPase [Eubacteriaceae bacterium]|nr:MoxR family ATPase [Eubacteriaceae bacterium]